MNNLDKLNDVCFYLKDKKLYRLLEQVYQEHILEDIIDTCYDENYTLTEFIVVSINRYLYNTDTV